MRAILTYHSIDASGSPISCSPEAFDRHVAWLSSGRVKATTLDDLVSLPADSDAVAVTFDDAFLNFRETAAPRLMAHGIPATVFVAADHAGGTNAWGGVAQSGIPLLPILDWDSLASLQRQGIGLGAHSRTHPDLTRIPAAQLDDEIRGAADLIQRETGSRPTSFAYPYGRYDQRAETLVRAAYKYGCGVEFRVLDDSSRVSALPRLDMFYFQEPGRLEGWGTPEFARFIAVRRRLRRIREGWQEVVSGMLR